MRRAFYFTFLACSLLINASACTNGSEPEPETESFFRVTQDGTAWQEPGRATYNKGFRSFSITSSKAAGNSTTQALSIGFTVPNLQRPATTGAVSTEWLQLVGGDAVSNQFSNANAPGAPTLQITRLDTVRKVIEGRFEVTLQRNERYTQQEELMRLTDGSFRVTYQER